MAGAQHHTGRRGGRLSRRARDQRRAPRFFFLPSDADVSDQIRLRRTSLDYVDLKRSLASLADRGKALLVLDACRSGNALGTRSVDTGMDKVIRELSSAIRSGRPCCLFRDGAGARA